MQHDENKPIIHTYICHVLQKLLDRHGETYLTKAEMQSSEPISTFFEGRLPDFLIKTRPGGRAKPLIVNIEMDQTPTAAPNKFGSVADAMTLRPNNLLTDLIGLLPMVDRVFLHRNIHVFAAEYRTTRVLMNSTVRITLRSDSRDLQATAQFLRSMTEYASRLIDRSGI
jgi:hypothetical protein